MPSNNDSSTIEVTLVDATIHLARGNNVLTVTVPEHELEVLKVIHGAGRVAKVKHADPDDEPGVEDLSASAADEMLRLENRYRPQNGVNPVLEAFRDGERSLERYGFESGGTAKQAPGAQVVRRKPAKSASKAKSAKSDK